MSKIKIACIVGATASGKTDVSVLAAKMLKAEIISADSIQVYKHLDIGSAKPTENEKCGVIHHMMDCIEPSEKSFSVSEYTQSAKRIIYDIADRNKLPLIVGGTGLYINALTQPLNFAEVGSDEQLRNELKQSEENSPGILFETLKQIDPITAQRLHPNDIKRIIRAIEVFKISGKPLSQHGNDFTNSKGNESEFESCIIGITMPREILYSRIEKRVDIMFEQGLLEETKQIIDSDGFNRDYPAMQALGYKQLISYLLDKNPSTLEETIDKIKLETRHFAKRQLTWFRRDKRINWIDITQFNSKQEAADKICNIISNF